MVVVHRILSKAARNGSASASGRRTIHIGIVQQQRQRRSLMAHQQQQQEAEKVPFYGAPRPSASSSSRKDDIDSSCAAAVRDAGERLWLTWRHALTAVRDPTRADAVAAVGELTGRRALQTMLEGMRAHPTGRQILRDRPVVSKATIPYDRLLREARELQQQQQQQPSHNNNNNKTNNNENIKKTTFGQAYGAFLLQHGFDPDERDAVRYLNNNNTENEQQQQQQQQEDDDADLAYVMLRYRQCHDFWHALTGLPPTVAGELGLKWLELFQTGLPLAALSCTAGSWALLSSNNPNNDLHAVWNAYLPWARRCHHQMEPFALLNVYYEREWDAPLDELRRRLRLEPAPVVD